MITDFKFADVLAGQVSVSPRPSASHVKAMANQGVTHVFTLQSAKESPREVQEHCTLHGINWVWIELPGANKRIMKSPSTRELISSGLSRAKDFLENRAKLVIHCAAGIHRTGVFLYALLRICGRCPEETLDTILAIRQVTWERCGQFRIQVAEQIAQRFIEKQANEFPVPLASSLQALRSAEVYLWAESYLTLEGLLVLELCFTDNTISRCYPLDEIVVRADYRALRAALGEEWFAAKLAGVHRDVEPKDIQREERRLVAAVKEVGSVTAVAGRHADLELTFMQHFLPTVHSLVQSSPVIYPCDIDLTTCASVLMAQLSKCAP